MYYLIHAFACYTAPVGNFAMGRHGWRTDVIPPQDVPPECCYVRLSAAQKAADKFNAQGQGLYLYHVLPVPDAALRPVQRKQS